ncbi:methylenetetrahydrofolate reductase (NADPH) [Sphaeroforma arctica JP610]|uniref:Methylenetetrahydrofolate reductase (NADPH) n=1 Tax=Sphaeroforma arctica JP610 TaxID=667725 RepID=A0A0L0G039_9EUKA|nr:methylenetetrahydrofolate reductase (NADPH) [Sphaeroforma arctica JP610]KNC82214.1 methylenetetrahydrofolate reductase (NADPH) [Sphaeroforma arctica JP610]|eukprot:XP_014156116.1 methylenetetrahydrofolate reductase (NADPH) [Sphaeroforma arctica JP610]
MVPAKLSRVPSDPNLRNIPKIVDKINLRKSEGKTFYSFEYFPPKTTEGAQNLYARVERMSSVEPLFVDMTWGAGGSTSEMTLELCTNIQTYLGMDVMMHLTCTNMPRSMIDNALTSARANGVRNILALRGDPPAGQDWQACEDGFAHATDLVSYIRQTHGDYFCICVAGYPEGHPAGSLDGKITYEEELQFLKQKIDAGADVIITQLFFDTDLFLEFIDKCREIGIDTPILPGIMPIQSYAGFHKMVGFCKVKVPQFITDQLEAVKDDDAKIKELGVRIGVDTCKKLLESGKVPGLHFYTLNLEKMVMSIIDGLQMVPTDKAIRSLPWRPSTADRRRSEDVRPIYWANRPKSYLSRTATWDDFPNGRWGDRRSPAFGDVGSYYIFNPSRMYNPKVKETYGPCDSIDAIADVFVKYLSGGIKVLPWSETEMIAIETAQINDDLLWLNQNHLFTINSQPRVNGVPSTDASFGWGPEGGYVYQKAYLEFFATKDIVDKLFEAVKTMPSFTLYAASKKSKSIMTNAKRPDTATAVTWGVFPETEVLQPTIVDPASFMAWKDEAFSLWLDVWMSMFNLPEEQKARDTIKYINEEFYLVNVVDHDFRDGNIFRAFDGILPAKSA